MTNTPTPEGNLETLIKELREAEEKATYPKWSSEFDRCEPLNEWGTDVLSEYDEDSDEVRKSIEYGQVISYDVLSTNDDIPEVKSQDARLICLTRNNLPLLLDIAESWIKTNEVLENWNWEDFPSPCCNAKIEWASTDLERDFERNKCSSCTKLISMPTQIELFHWREGIRKKQLQQNKSLLSTHFPEER